MKKLYTLALGLFLGISAFAQVDETFVFTDKDGNIIPDGSIITVNNYELDELTDDMMFPSGLYVANVSGANAFAGMKIDVKNMDNGYVNHCFPGACQPVNGVGVVERTDVKGMRPDTSESISSEWIPVSKGTCSVTYTIRVMEFVPINPPRYEEAAIGASVTVNYVYDDNSKEITAGISEITTTSGNADSSYNLSGQKVAGNYKGVVIKNNKKYINR